MIGVIRGSFDTEEHGYIPGVVDKDGKVTFYPQQMMKTREAALKKADLIITVIGGVVVSE